MAAMAVRAVTLDTRQSLWLCVEGGTHQGASAKVIGTRVSRSVGFMSSMDVSSWSRKGPVIRLRRRNSRKRGMVVIDNLGGSYEESFDDVHTNLMNYFTYKAVKTVLTQLYEMNPPSYRWLWNYCAANNPKDGKYFLRALGKERQELAERIMITRLHLYGKWIKKCDHAKMYQKISDENLELMRERLMETVIWPSDDTNTSTEKIGYD